MPASGGVMNKNPIFGEVHMDRRIEEIAETLDDITTTLDELKEEPCSASRETLERMRQSIEKATDAVDRIANQDATADQFSQHARDGKTGTE